MTLKSSLSKPTVTLEPTSPTATRKFQARIIVGVTRSRMQALAMFFAPLFGSYNVKFSNKFSPGLEDTARKLVAGATPPSLEFTREGFAALFANPDNIRLAYEAQPDCYKAVYDRIFENVFVNDSFLRTTCDAKLTKVALPGKKGSITETYATPERIADILQRVGTGYRTDAYTIEMHLLEHMGKAVNKGIFRQAEDFRVDELPADSGLRTWSCADTFIGLLGAISSSFKKHEVEVTATNGIVKAQSIKMFALSYPVEEFFPQAPVRQMRDMRLRTMLSFFDDAYTRRTDYSTPTAEALAKLHSQYAAGSYTTFSLALPWIGGLRKGVFEGSEYYKAYSAILSFFRETAVKEGPGPWFDAQALAHRIFINLPANTRYGFNPKQVLGIYNLTNGANGSVIRRTNLVESTALAAPAGIMVNMCATGLLEMAVSAPKADVANPLECVRYVRLSAFGRYAFGIDKEYSGEIAAVKVKVQAELEPDSLIITALTPSAVPVIRNNFGVGKGANRFMATPEAIFRKATDVYTLNQQKERLLTLTGLQKLPPLWEEFFDSIRRRYDALTEKSMNDSVYYAVDPSCPGLAETITSDPDIRRMVRLVEGNGFIISRADFPQLRDLLRDHGYLLPAPKTHYYYY